MNTKRLLEKHHIRASLPRREILDVVQSFKKRHFSVEDILVRLKKKKSPVSRASAYRVVNVLAATGFLNSLDLGQGYQMYEVAAANRHHDHLYCMRCGRIWEFHEQVIEDLQEKVCARSGFTPREHSLRIIGVCKKCKS